MREDKSSFTIALECDHQVSSDDDSTCWDCTVKMFNHDAEETRRADAAESRSARLEAERDIYKNGFDALTTVCDQIVAERDYLQRRVESLQGALNTVDRALAQHQQTRRELLETIAELKRENEQLQSEIDYLRSTDHAADLAFERAQKIGAAYVIDETQLGIALDGQGDEVEP